jgi:hypothetical protein
MVDDKAQIGGADRRSVALDQRYEVEDFRQKYKHLFARRREAGHP